MRTYRVEAFRHHDSECPFRAVTFLVDADSCELAEEMAAAYLACIPGPDEMAIDSAHEVAL